MRNGGLRHRYRRTNGNREAHWPSAGAQRQVALAMGTTRLEAPSDAVLAIIWTIVVAPLWTVSDRRFEAGAVPPPDPVE